MLSNNDSKYLTDAPGQKPGFLFHSMVIAIFGTGLIGCSLAYRLRETGFAQTFIGVDNNPDNLREARRLGWIDVIMEPEEALAIAELVILAVPVDVAARILPGILDCIGDKPVMDVGSTKKMMGDAVKDHFNRKQYVASHPMWGTEKSGPSSVVMDAFEGRVSVICDKERSAPEALEMIEKLYSDIGMKLVYMDSDVHDMHAAYVSHISHIASYALSLTVLEKEKEEDAIFELASGGFESTVRLAKSHPAMWVPIFMQNRDNVLDVLNEHIVQLRKFKSCLEKENYTYLQELITQANSISRILK